MALERRTLEFTFAIGKGTYGLSGANTLTISGMKATAKVSNAGGAMAPTFDISVNGMTLSQMNQLTTIGSTPEILRLNTILIRAGDKGKTLTQIFEGMILNAWFDGTAAPEIAFRATGTTAAFEAVKPVPAQSYKGGKDAVEMLEAIAKKMNVKFENNGVPPTIITDQNLPAENRAQALSILRATPIDWNGVENGVFAIWPKFTGHRRGDTVLITPQSGQVLYPMLTQTGIKVRSLFAPNLRFGGLFQVKNSVLQPALQRSNQSSTWRVIKMDHELSSETPQGPWFTDIDGQAPNFLLGVAPSTGSVESDGGGAAP